MQTKAKAPAAVQPAAEANYLSNIHTAENIEPAAFLQVVCRLSRRFSLTEPHARTVAELARLGGSAR